MPRSPLSLQEVTAKPYNAETPLSALMHEITPTDLVYVRNHFDLPQADLGHWRLHVGGEVNQLLSLSLNEIQALPSRSLEVTLECAGNGRRALEPAPKGTPWGYGAVSVVSFTGTPVTTVLEQAGLSDNAVEVIFKGADLGDKVPGRTEHYARSLPLSVAQSADTLLAWEMNGERLPASHGFPLRLVVPGWYGMASVKWLQEIAVASKPFGGTFQSEEYIYVEEEGTPEGEPVTQMRVRSLILQPSDGAELGRGQADIVGIAWSGHGEVARVEVSFDDGGSWAEAVVEAPRSAYRPQRWSASWRPEASGSYSIRARATDSAGNTQPMGPRWNRLGYGNNGSHAVTVSIS